MRNAPREGPCARAKRSKTKTEAPPWKLLLWTVVAGIIFGLIGAGEILEGPLRTVRNSFHSHKASGDIVLVAIDNQSLNRALALAAPLPCRS